MEIEKLGRARRGAEADQIVRGAHHRKSMRAAKPGPRLFEALVEVGCENCG